MDTVGQAPRPLARAAPAGWPGRLLLLTAWLALLCTGLVVFHRLGHGALAAPPLTDADAWRTWGSDRHPLLAVAAVGRLVVLGLAWYLAVVTAAGLLARLLRVAALVRALDAVSLPTLRPLLDRVVGVSVVTGLLTVPVAVAAARPNVSPPPAVTLASETSGPLPLELVEPRTDDDLAEVDDAESAVEPVPDQDIGRTEGSVRHEVRPGESFWRIAADLLAQAWERPPSDREVVGYWRELIEANRARLADPGNADLIFPGQQLVVPPVPERPR